MIQSGDTIGPYTLVRTLGRGTFGEVWLAERRSSLLTTQVALKLPLDAGADLDAIRLEAQIWLRASGHPNVVPVMDAEVYDGQVVIASEYVAGGSLEDWLSQHGGKAISTEAAIKMAVGILAGLEHLHENSLIHRDLKPANILLQREIPRLTDFGLTRVLKPSGHSTNLAGTPQYMAPEAFKGQYSAASDVWAVGMLLYEMLTGTLPYAQSDFYSLLLAITSEAPVAISDQVPDLLRPVLATALAKSVIERFASAREMMDALHAAVTPRAVSVVISSLETNHNLPIQMTSFIGREKEIAEVKSRLAQTRLLTLTGSGGTGKTRLLLQVAAEVVCDFSDGVWLVELAPLTDPGLMQQAVATVLSVREEPGRPLMQTLMQTLKPKNLMLLLDNCEHVLDAAASLTDALLTHCPGLRIVASSRESLGTAGERTYRVPSLSLPSSIDQADGSALGEILGSEAVLLFAGRAAMLNSDFSLTPANAFAVARLCYRLDGIPLAIELAAARVRSLPVEQIEARLHDRFRLLTGGSRTALPRQQTLRALIDWSYDLLSDAEKALLLRLSVFAGGWSLEAAEQVCAGDGVEDWETLDLLTALVDKSLVLYDEQQGNARYRLLETVRQYARDRIVESGEAGAYRSRHRNHFLFLAEEAARHLQGPDQRLLLDRLEIEHDNIRQAMTFCIEDVGDGETGLQFGLAMAQFWAKRGHLSEGRERLTALLDRPAARGRTHRRAGALNGAGSLCRLQGDFSAARVLLEECLAIWRNLGDRPSSASALNNLGLVAYSQGDYTSARSLHEECLEIGRGLENSRQIAASLNNLGMVATAQRDYAYAQSLYEESLEIKRKVGDKLAIATTIANLGLLASFQGDYASGSTLCRESLEIARELGDLHAIAICLGCLVSVQIDQGDYTSARALTAESLAICQELGDRNGILNCLRSFAHLNAKEERREVAVRLWGAAERLREEIGSVLAPDEQDTHDRDVADARQALGEEAFSAAWAEGRALTMEQAIESALDDGEVSASDAGVHAST